MDEYPEGYGKLAAFVDCDPNFLIYRKFGWLHNRVLLQLQDELQLLEQKLENIDKWEAESGEKVRLISQRSDKTPTRKNLFTDIKAKLEEYGEQFPQA